MASKFLSFHMLLALATLSVVQLKVGGASPVIHFISAVTGNNSPKVSIQIKAGGSWKGSTQLSLSTGQEYNINVDVNDVYYASAMFGLKFTAFHAYEPARDKGKPSIYWKADTDGFAISYDKTSWKEVAPWESE